MNSVNSLLNIILDFLPIHIQPNVLLFTKMGAILRMLTYNMFFFLSTTCLRHLFHINGHLYFLVAKE